METITRTPDFKYGQKVVCPKCGSDFMRLHYEPEYVWYSYEGNFLFDLLGLRNTRHIMVEHINLDCTACDYFVGTREVRNPSK